MGGGSARTSDVTLTRGLGGFPFETQVRRTGNSRDGQLGDYVIFFKDEMERAQISDLQCNLAVPASMNRGCSEVDLKSCSSSRAFCIDESDETRVRERSTHLLFRGPEHETTWFDDYLPASAANWLLVPFFVGLCFIRRIDEVSLAKLAIDESAQMKFWASAAGAFLVLSKGVNVPDLGLFNLIKVQID